MPTEEEIMEALKDVIDPEIGMNVVELGLIYGIQLEDEGKKVKVRMTLTVPGCPLAQMITEYVGRRIHQIDGVEHVDVELTFDPPWSPEMMTEDARKRLGL